MIDNQKVVLRLIEEYFNRRDETVWPALVHPDLLIHEDDVTIQGATQADVFYMQVLFQAFPDFYITVDAVSSSGEKVVLSCRESGTMTGKLGERPPTGHKFTTQTTRVCRLVDGKVIELLRFLDTGIQLRRLDSPPTPAQPGENIPSIDEQPLQAKEVSSITHQ